MLKMDPQYPPGDARVRPQQLSAWVEATTETFQERWFEAPMKGVGTGGER